MMELLQQVLDTFKGSEQGGCCSCLLYSFYVCAMVVGTFQAVVIVYHILAFHYKHLGGRSCSRQTDLAKRYGRGSWVVVTGASDGIGAAYCVELASKGFCVALVSRTKSKLEAVEKKCKEAGAPQTRLVVADFTCGDKPSEAKILAFYKDIYRQLEDLDISILINNAGLMFTGAFFETSEKSSRWKDIIDVNVMQVAMMTYLFKDKLAARQAQGRGVHSALINVSSVIGYQHGCAGAAVYCASKAYVNYLTIALAQELAGQLDVQCLTPSSTRTNLLGEHSKREIPFASITSVDCVKGSLRDLGHQGLLRLAFTLPGGFKVDFGGYLLTGDITTGGDIRHDLQTYFMGPLSKLSIFQLAMGIIFGRFMKH